MGDYVKLSSSGEAVRYTKSQLRFDNPSTSFPRDIPDALLAQYDVFPVTVLDRPITTRWQKAEKDATPALIDGTWTLGWLISETPLEEAKQQVLGELADRRWKAEEGGTTLNGAVVATDRTTQAKVTAAYIKATADSAYTIAAWKGADGTFSPLDAATIIAIADAIEAHVQACFSNEADLAEQISAATTLTELDSVDIETGWP